MGVDLWAFKIKESSRNKDIRQISWGDEEDSYLTIDEMLPCNYFSNIGLSSSDWKLFKHIGMNLQGDPYMSNENFAKSVDIFNEWYKDWIEVNDDATFVLWDEDNGHPIANYHTRHLKDLHEYLNVWANSGQGVWISI